MWQSEIFEMLFYWYYLLIFFAEVVTTSSCEHFLESNII